MPTLLLRSGRLFDPARGLDRTADLLIDCTQGVIATIGAGLQGDATLDCAGLLVCPGFVDAHVHFREPGFTAKETIATGSAAAVHGGFTSVILMPNTDPPLDNVSALAYQYLKAGEADQARVYPMGCISRGQQGRELADLGLQARAGAVAFTDDGHCVPNAFLLRLAFEYARALGKVVVEHCEDQPLSQGAVMHEGRISAKLGINGYPSAAEEIVVNRDIRLAKLADARFHVSHISAKGSVALVREAKSKGTKVSAEVTPHHLLLTDECCASFDPLYRMNPPLRDASDTAACLEGLVDGTIDCLASDHAPHTLEEKALEFTEAPNGVIGLESSIGVLLDRLVRPGKLSLARFVEAWTSAPTRCFGLPGGTLAEGAPGDITVLDLGRTWTISAERFKSKGRNCPFKGWEVTGAPVWTVVGGKVFTAIGQTGAT